MNKYQEAIQNLQTEVPTNNTDIPVLRELVDKATPKKVEIEGSLGGVKFGKCPNCHMGCNSEMKYCDNCGQALDWGESDE